MENEIKIESLKESEFHLNIMIDNPDCTCEKDKKLPAQCDSCRVLVSKRIKQAMEWNTRPEAIEEGRINRLKFLEGRRRSCLSRWFPLVKNLVPVPRTEIVTTNVDLEQLWNGKEPELYDNFITELAVAAKNIGYPFFFRTGLSSNKHGWKHTCYLTKREDIPAHLYEHVEYAGMHDLPLDVWVLREMLPVNRLFTAFTGEMPITREFRYFVKDGKVICHHPYWPENAIEHQFPSDENWKRLLSISHRETNQEVDMLTRATESIGQAVKDLGEFWSVDWLETQKGWYLIDMGQGAESYHWEGCPNEHLMTI